MPYGVDEPRYCPGTHCNDECPRCYTTCVQVPYVRELSRQLEDVVGILQSAKQAKMANHRAAVEIANTIANLRILIQKSLMEEEPLNNSIKKKKFGYQETVHDNNNIRFYIFFIFFFN